MNNLDNAMMDFNATSLYPSSMWDEKSVYRSSETGFAFKPHMNDVFVETYYNQTFNQDGNESPFLKMNNFNPPNLIFHYRPTKS